MSTSDLKSVYDDGTRMRTSVLGADHVANSTNSATPFTRPAQELVTSYCWGQVWTRPGLDKRTRSLVNVAMLTALNQHHELSVHVRGAIRNGCTEDEIQEVLLQAMVYCGAPAGLAAFRTAEDALAGLRDAES